MALVNTDLLMSMINDILDYCQIKDNKLRLVVQEFSLCELLGQVYNLMKIQTNLKGIDFYVKNKVGNIQILSDMRRIKQILINLLSNAIKFTEEGYIKIIVTTINLPDKICFSVEDTGPGISQEVVKRLGQPFATFGTATNQNKGGIGLGLNFCQQLIGLLGPNSSFQVKTELGTGTKFSFVIYTNLDQINQENSEFSKDICEEDPIKSEEIESASHISLKEIYQQDYFFFVNYTVAQSYQEIDSPYKNESIQDQLTILIVDDNVFNLLVLENQLKKICPNWKILKANNGKQAVDKFCSQNQVQHKNNINLIIMDCEMPIMDGYEASKSIMKKISDKNYFKAEIIGYTALLGINEETKCLQSGMCDMIAKPAMFNDLKLKVLKNFQKFHN